MTKNNSVLSGKLSTGNALKNAKVVPLKVKTEASVAKEKEKIKAKKKPAGKK